MIKILTNPTIPTGGFPLYGVQLSNLQNEIYNALYSGYYRFTNESFILSGCQISNIVTGSSPSVTISPGYVFLNNSTNGTDTIYFTGGTFAYPLWICEDTPTTTQLQFKNGNVQNAVVTKNIKAVNSNPGGACIEFNPYTSKTFEKLSQRYGRFIGEVFDYSGSFVNSNGFPLFDSTGLGLDYFDGFALANGQNGTKDLRGQFIAGLNPDDSDYLSIGQTGGAKTVTLATDNIPLHTHNVTVSGQTITPNAVTSVLGGSSIGTANNGSGLTLFTNPQMVASGTFTTDGGNGTGSTPIDKRPPYYVLAKVQRIN